MAKKLAAKAAHEALRERALAYPEATEDFPWGERVVKVKKKVFVFLGVPQKKSMGLSVKLPQSAGAALMAPFAKPTGYGLGKAGWVTMSFEDPDEIPLDLLLTWLDESYRAVAPKKLVAALDAQAADAPAPAKKKVAAKKKATRTRGRAGTSR